MNRLIEDYLSARDARYFRGHHDDEYFFLVDFVVGAYRGRLNVHLEACDVDPNAVLVTISPDRYYPRNDGNWLTRLTDRWNAGAPGMQAVTHGSCDPHLVGVTARGRCTATDLGTLTRFVDGAVVSAVELFGDLAQAELPSPGPVLRDAG